MKKFFTILLVFLFPFLLFGCGSVTLSTRVLNSGVMTCKFEVSLDSTFSSYAPTIREVFEKYSSQIDKSYEKNLVLKFSKVYNDFEEVDLVDFAKKINYSLLDSDFLDEEKTVLKDGNAKEALKVLFIKNKNPNFIVGTLENEEIKNSSNDIVVKNNGMFLSLSKGFVSVYAYIFYFYPDAFEYNEAKNQVTLVEDYHALIDAPISEDLTFEEGLLINKYVQTFKPFFYNGKQPCLLEDCSFTSGQSFEKGQTLVEVLSGLTGKTENDLTKVFNFSTTFRRLHSNADKISSNDGYTHTWTLKSLNDGVKVWRNYANYTVFYVFAVIASVAVVVCGLLTIKIVSDIKKKKGLKYISKINDFVNKDK